MRADPIHPATCNVATCRRGNGGLESGCAVWSRFGCEIELTVRGTAFNAVDGHEAAA